MSAHTYSLTIRSKKGPRRMVLNLAKVPGMGEGGEGETESQIVLTARLANEKDPKLKKAKKPTQVSSSFSS